MINPSISNIKEPKTPVSLKDLSNETGKNNSNAKFMSSRPITKNVSNQELSELSTNNFEERKRHKRELD